MNCGMDAKERIVLMSAIPAFSDYVDPVYSKALPMHQHEHIGRLARMSVLEYRGRRFEPRQKYVVSLSKKLYPHCFSRLS